MAEPTWADFRREYPTALVECARAKPEVYRWPLDRADTIAKKMLDGLESGIAEWSGESVKLTCKRIGIKHTRSAINTLIKTAREVA